MKVTKSDRKGVVDTFPEIGATSEAANVCMEKNMAYEQTQGLRTAPEPVGEQHHEYDVISPLMCTGSGLNNEHVYAEVQLPPPQFLQYANNDGLTTGEDTTGYVQMSSAGRLTARNAALKAEEDVTGYILMSTAKHSRHEYESVQPQS